MICAFKKIDGSIWVRGRHTHNTMSWSQRFMEKKSEGSAAEWRSTEAKAGAGGGGGGGEWKTVSSGWQPRAAAGGSWKPKSEAPKPVLNMDSEEQFPSLGAKPRPTAEQARLQGFAALAASWASQDAAEAAEMKRQRDEAQKEAEKRAKEAAHYGVLESIMRRRAENTFSGGYGESAADYEKGGNGRSYSPHSPTYPPYDEEPEESTEEESRSNPMFTYNHEEEEGWTTH